MILSLWSMPNPSEAVLGVGDAVYDYAVHFESITTAIMTTQTVVNQILDLTPVDELIADQSTPMELLGFLVNIACHPPSGRFSLSFRILDICSAFDRLYPAADRVPETSFEYVLWQQEKEEQTRQSAATAMRTQALIEMLGRDSESLAGLLRQVLSVIGNLQGVQVHHQIAAQHNTLAIRAQLMNATFQRAMTTKLADEATSIESLRRINANIWSTWPGMAP